LEQLVASAAIASTSDGLTESLARLDEALGLWRGRFLENVDRVVAPGEATRLEELRLVALERRVDVLLALGRHREIVGELRRRSSTTRSASAYTPS
jgi:hypothetical protein